jgi:hypothetical protein
MVPTGSNGPRLFNSEYTCSGHDSIPVLGDALAGLSGDHKA